MALSMFLAHFAKQLVKRPRGARLGWWLFSLSVPFGALERRHLLAMTRRISDERTQLKLENRRLRAALNAKPARQGA